MAKKKEFVFVGKGHLATGNRKIYQNQVFEEDVISPESLDHLLKTKAVIPYDKKKNALSVVSASGDSKHVEKLKKELEAFKAENSALTEKVATLEAEKEVLTEQLDALKKPEADGGKK